METNTLPRYDDSENTTGCCPRFHPEGWDQRHLHFKNKRFLRATTRSVMHVPVNMGSTFERVNEAVEANGGWDMDDMIVLSRDLTAWRSEHLFAVQRDIPGEEMVRLSGEFLTRVFEGPYRHAPE